MEYGMMDLADDVFTIEDGRITGVIHNEPGNMTSDDFAGEPAKQEEAKEEDQINAGEANSDIAEPETGTVNETVAQAADGTDDYLALLRAQEKENKL